jgi:hypothetical protein
MSDPDPFADLAVGLNEDAKAERARKPTHEDVNMAATAEQTAADLDGHPEPEPEPAEPEATEAAPAKRGRKTLFERMAAETAARQAEEAEFVEEAPEVEAIEIAAEGFSPDPSEAVQALRDYTLQIIKDLDKPWHKLPQERQIDLARAIEHSSKDVVRTIVETVASRGQKPVRVLLKKIAAGDKIQITGEVSLLGTERPDDSLLLLHHAIGKHVMLTRATVDDYAQGGEAETDPDEPALEFDSEPIDD